MNFYGSDGAEGIIFETLLFEHWVIWEKHKKCNCSYCKEFFIDKCFGFAKGTGKFHWTIIQWKWNGFDYYFRWT